MLEREERRGKERETSIGYLPQASSGGPGPATQACALTGNQTGDLSILRLALNPLSHTSQGTCEFLFCEHMFIVCS